MSIRTATLVLCGALAVLGGDRAANAQTALPCTAFTSEALPLPAPRATEWPVNRLHVINEQVRNMPHRVLFLGDSLADRFPYGAPLVWREHMQPRGVLNAGVSGDETENLLWRLQNGNLEGPPPTLAIMLIGINDLTYSGSPRSPELAAEGIRANLLYLRRQLPDTQILLLGLLPRGTSPTADLRRKVIAVNQLISSCADRRAVFYADIGGALLDAQGRLTAEVSPDQVHFSEIGYAKLAPLLAEMIDNLTRRR